MMLTLFWFNLSIFSGKIPIASLDLALTFWALLRQLKNKKKSTLCSRSTRKNHIKLNFSPSYIHPVFTNYCYVLLHACLRFLTVFFYHFFSTRTYIHFITAYIFQVFINKCTYFDDFKCVYLLVVKDSSV